MAAYDYNRPYIARGDMRTYVAMDAETASEYGRTVKATELSNVEYKIRFAKLKRENNMKLPPSCERIFTGYLVIRRLGTKQQYETWMPDDVFEELYAPAA
jgi:hypothetical protein